MKPRIFIINDAISVRALIREALQAFRVEVVGTARTARGALSRMGSLAPDLVILHTGIENADTDEMIAAIGNQAEGACAVFVAREAGPDGPKDPALEGSGRTRSRSPTQHLPRLPWSGFGPLWAPSSRA